MMKPSENGKPNCDSRGEEFLYDN